MLTKTEGIYREPATVQDGPPSTAQQPFNWRAHLRVHPAAELFPLMSELELKELAKDIKARGCLLEAITLWRQNENDDWQLLDGRNRLDAMVLAGMLEVNVHSRLCHAGHADKDWTIYTKYRSGGDPYAIALSLNVHRRHLNAEQKRELIANVLKLNPKKSNRQIAEQVKDDHKKVGDVRSKLETTGAIPQLKKTEGKDGKARPTKAKKKKSVPIIAPIETVNGAEPEAKPVSASAETSLERRRAEHAALDLSHEEKAEAEFAECLKAGDAAHKASGHALDEFTTACRAWLPKVTEQSHQYKALHLAKKMTESGGVTGASGLGSAIESEWLEAERAYEALTAHTVARLASAIPPGKAALVREIADYFIALAAKLTARSAGNGEAPIAGSDYSIPDDLSIAHGLKRGDAS